MKKIEVPGEINEASQLILDESLEEIKPQKVEIDIWFRDDEEEEYRERTKEEILDGIREGFRDCLTGNTRPIEELWDNILISTTGTIDDDGNLVLDEPLRETKAQYVDVVIWFIKNQASLEKHPDNIDRSQQEMDTAELIVSRK
jgi:hypothetical protein